MAAMMVLMWASSQAEMLEPFLAEKKGYERVDVTGLHRVATLDMIQVASLGGEMVA